MEIITKTTDFYLREESAAAIGKFDGVHVGHRRLLEEILDQKKAGRKACVFTFDPPPSVFFGKTEVKNDKGPRALSSAGSEHLPYKQRVGGSNPSAPTSEHRTKVRCSFRLYL